MPATGGRTSWRGPSAGSCPSWANPAARLSGCRSPRPPCGRGCTRRRGRSSPTAIARCLVAASTWTSPCRRVSCGPWPTRPPTGASTARTWSEAATTSWGGASPGRGCVPSTAVGTATSTSSSTAGRRSNEAMVAWIAESEEVPEALRKKDWDAFNVGLSTQEEIDELERPFVEFLARRTKEEFAAESVRRSILGYPVADARDIRTDPQLAARGFWQEVWHPELGVAVTYPGPFARFSAGRCGIRRPAPRIGEHNLEVYGELGMTPGDVATLREEGVL